MAKFLRANIIGRLLFSSAEHSTNMSTFEYALINMALDIHASSASTFTISSSYLSNNRYLIMDCIL